MGNFEHTRGSDRSSSRDSSRKKDDSIHGLPHDLVEAGIELYGGEEELELEIRARGAYLFSQTIELALEDQHKASSKKAAHPGAAQHIQGDDLVMRVGVDGEIVDVEAEKARGMLRQKIRSTERAIQKGANDALLHQLGVHTKEKDEAAQEKTVEAIKDPFKEKIVEFIKGKALQAKKVKGGGAAGNAMKNKLASEGAQARRLVRSLSSVPSRTWSTRSKRPRSPTSRRTPGRGSSRRSTGTYRPLLTATSSR